MKAKYPNGTRVKVKYGHLLYKFDKEADKLTGIDIRPELTEDLATVMYTYGEKAETDPKYSHDTFQAYAQYCLKFDHYGEISWFHESHLISQ